MADRKRNRAPEFGPSEHKLLAAELRKIADYVEQHDGVAIKGEIRTVLLPPHGFREISFELPASDGGHWMEQTNYGGSWSGTGGPSDFTVRPPNG